MKKLFKVLGIIFAIFFIMIVLAAIFADGDTSAKKAESSSTQVNTEESSSAQENAEEPSTEEPSAEQENTEESSAAQDSEEEAPLVTTARELVADYEANEIAADKKYKGKILEISGKVAGIDSGFNDKAVVRLIGMNEFQTASAQGDDEFTTYAGTLKKGQKITLICKSDGEFIGFPQLSKCKPKQ